MFFYNVLNLDYERLCEVDRETNLKVENIFQKDSTTKVLLLLG